MLSFNTHVAYLARQREREVSEAREEAWAQGQASATLSAKLDTLKAALEERRRDCAGYREALVAAGEREREAARRLTQAALQAEEALEAREAALAAENEALVKSLMEQRDAANAALAVRLPRRDSGMN